MAAFVRRFVAGFQMLGSIVGLGVTTLGAFTTSGPSAVSLLVSLAAVGFFGASGVAGFLLWRGEALGLRLSLVAQIAQVPLLTTTLLTYRAQTPVSINLSFDSAWNLGVQADVGSYFALVLGRTPSAQVVGVNLLALGCIVALVRSARSLTSA